MKVLKLLAVTAALSASGLAMADGSVVDQGYAFEANKLIPTGARLEVGTTGYGGALLWTANPYVGLALGYNGGDISWSDDIKVNGTKYDWDQDNKTAYLNAEIRPWGASQNVWAQGLYVAAGVGYIDNEYGLKGKVSGQDTIKINGDTYVSNNGTASVTGKMSYDNQFAPYVGFGFAPKINKNFGVFGEVGAYYTGNPSAQLVASNNLSPIRPDLAEYANAQDAADADARKIQNDDKYKWLPVGKVGVSYHW
ncbi:ornithine uptake porin CarO [Acinetobacter guillouiae]|jgi:hypothetical protein|uniref:ornithine uptake porin CarO n=1 Tax=Acinetobacter guillouiae TaxID=106649 RepID=UPI003AF67CBB